MKRSRVGTQRHYPPRGMGDKSGLAALIAHAQWRIMPLRSDPAIFTCPDLDNDGVADAFPPCEHTRKASRPPAMENTCAWGILGMDMANAYGMQFPPTSRIIPELEN